jgi:DNA polymerase-1
VYEQPRIFFEEALPEPGSWKPPEVFPDLRAIPHFTLDTETTGKNPFEAKPIGLSLSWKAEGPLQSIYCPFGHAAGNMDERMVKLWASDILRGKTITFAHAKYDIHICKNWGLDLEALGVEPRDVQFNAALLDDSPHLKVDLDSLGIKYAGVGKEELPYDKNRMAELPSWLVGRYAERDSLVTYKVEDATLPLIKCENLERVLELENSIIYAVCEIERNGCRLDVEKLQVWREEIRVEYQKICMELFTMTGIKVEPDSPVSMAILFKHLNIAPPKPLPKKGRKKKKKGEQEEEEKTGKRKYTEEELLSLNHPVFNTVVKARWHSSLLSKFLDKYGVAIQGDLLRSQFHQLKTTTDDDEDDKTPGTISGRFSSSGGKDLNSGYSFNAQQVIKTKLQRDTLGNHHIVRELFIPKDGMKWLSADMSQIEYRIATHFANAERLIKAYQDPTTDFHATTQGWIQKYLPQFDDRTITKNTNFAYVFGSAEETLATTAGITIDQSRELLSILRREAPEFPRLLDDKKREAEDRGFVTTLYGRRARFGTYEHRFYAALNRVVQGSAADIFKVYLKAVYDERKTLGITALRQVVHDELNADLEPSDIYKERVKDFLSIQRVPLKVPVAWDIKTGRNWAECH